MTADEWVRDQLAKVTAERDALRVDRERLKMGLVAVGIRAADLTTDVMREAFANVPRAPSSPDVVVAKEEPSRAAPPDSVGYQTPSDVAQATGAVYAERDRYRRALESVWEIWNGFEDRYSDAFSRGARMAVTASAALDGPDR